MFKSFIVALFRNFSRNKFYVTLNVAGLSMGLICAIFIVLYVQDELSYDKYNVNYKRIVRLGSDFTLNGKRDKIATSALPFGPTLAKEFPEIEAFVRIQASGRQQLKYKEKEFYEKNISYVDSSVFEVFSFPLLKGDSKTALTKPYTIVLNQTLAKKYFGKKEPIGKKLRVGENDLYTVTGVMADLPKNSHFRFNGFYSMKTLEEARGAEIGNGSQPVSFWTFSTYTYLLLKENAGSAVLLKRFPMYYDKYMRKLGDQLGLSYNLIVQNLADIHLRSQLQWDVPTGNIKYIYILTAIAIFILSIASINYMNIATAQSAKRAKEVGVRKVIGASRESIIGQFMLESISLTLLALIIALICVELLLPLFNSLVNKDLVLSVQRTPQVILFNVILAILLGLFSGSYPSLYLSSFEPASILKGRKEQKRTNRLLRKLLVISQFTVSALMISGTIIVASQLFYMNSKDVGFNKKDVLVSMLRDSAFRTRINEFKTELKRNPNISEVATSHSLIGFGGAKTIHLYEGKEGMEQYVLNFNFVDFDYINLLEMEVVKGRGFDKSIASDTSNAFIINQAAAIKFEWGEDAVGRKLQLGVEIEDTDSKGVRSGKVIGVIRDFNYQPLKEMIEPMNLVVTENAGLKNILYVKISPDNKEETISYIEKIWDEFCPNMSFSHFFLEDRMKENYEPEKRLTWVFSMFSFVSILIAALGLFGLSSFMAEQRAKEIGVRKVLGASTGKLIYLLTREFLSLILIANLISIPISYWATSSWLNDFPYRIKISVWVFVATLTCSIIIGLCTVTWQAYRATMANPVDAIKYE